MLDATRNQGRFGAFLTATKKRTVVVLLMAYLTGGITVGLGIILPNTLTKFLLALGVGLALAGLLGIREWLAKYFKESKTPTWVLVALAPVLLAIALAFISLAANVISGVAALAGFWIAGLGLVGVGSAVAEYSKNKAVFWTLTGLGVLATAVALGAWLSTSDWAIVLAALVVAVGLSITNQGLVSLASKQPRIWLAVGLAIIASSALFLSVLWLMGSSGLAAVPVLFVFVLGLVPLSKAVPYRVTGSGAWSVATLLLFGAGAGAVLTVAFSRADWPIAVAFAAILLCLVFSAALVWEISELAVILVLGAVMTGVLIDRADENLLSPHDQPPARLVVFGDSYASGEGADEFFPGTNVAGEDECRRSSSAYSYLVASRLGYGLDFYACSGAETYEVATGAAANLTASRETQIEQFLSEEEAAAKAGETKPPIAAVLISIGGNDAWFGTVGQACLGPGTCEVHRNILLRRAVDVDDRMGFAYKAIKDTVAEHVGGEVPVIAMPYPLIMTETGCEDSPLTRQEHQFLFEFTDVLNESARVQASLAGVNYFSPGVTAFEGARICDDDEWAVNVLDINPKEGTLLDRILPTNWVHGSAHPNELGHERTADALTPWLQELLATIESDPAISANPTSIFTPHRIFPSSTTNISTRSLGLPTTPCRGDAVNAVTVRVDPAVLGTEHLLTGVSQGSTVCHSQHDGTWMTNTQSSEDGTHSVPAWDREVELDFDPNRHSNRQVILWQGSSESWRVAVFDYCELDPDCADSESEVREWMLSQIEDTVRGGILPVLLMFAGAWFLSVDVKRGGLRREGESSSTR